MRHADRRTVARTSARSTDRRTTRARSRAPRPRSARVARRRCAHRPIRAERQHGARRGLSLDAHALRSASGRPCACSHFTCASASSPVVRLPRARSSGHRGSEHATGARATPRACGAIRSAWRAQRAARRVASRPSRKLCRGRTDIASISTMARSSPTSNAAAKHIAAQAHRAPRRTARLACDVVTGRDERERRHREQRNLAACTAHPLRDRRDTRRLVKLPGPAPQTMRATSSSSRPPRAASPRSRAAELSRPRRIATSRARAARRRAGAPPIPSTSTPRARASACRSSGEEESSLARRPDRARDRSAPRPAECARRRAPATRRE